LFFLKNTNPDFRFFNNNSFINSTPNY
jgi:hypothetical protein